MPQEEQECPRPYSALMSNLFSPPQTPAEEACAEAAASVMAGFKVPTPFEPCFYSQPDIQSVLVHSVSSTYAAAGFQAIIVLHPKSSLPSHLGLPQPSSLSSSSSLRLEETAFLMTAPANQPFLAFQHTPKASAMQVSLSEYLTLLTFWTQEWPRIQSKLFYQSEAMQTGQDLIPISTTLAFYHHGCSHYSVHLSSKLLLKAKLDSKVDAKEKNIRVWLELKASASSKSNNNSSSNNGSSHEGLTQVFGLPVEALNELTRDSNACNTLTNLVAGYKSRSRKRSKPVE